MRIAILGGLDRMSQHFEEAAVRSGHQVDHHHGRMTGPSSAGLKSAVSRADVLVIVTDINSHAAVSLAKSLARKRHVPVVMTRKLRGEDLGTIVARAA